MTRLYMVEVRPDPPSLLRFVRGQGLDLGQQDEDLGYAVHSWLAAAFGPKTIKPWRLLYDRRRPARILGYSLQDAPSLHTRLNEFAEPSVHAVCANPSEQITSRQMPEWRPGRRLGFEVQCCPVGRKAGSGIEKDIFLIKADEEGETGLDREIVYRDWLRERLERDRASTVTHLSLSGFRLIRQSRQTQMQGNGRTRSRLTRPLALFRGELIVEDPESFGRLLANGIGRHRAFGYGMLLLRPPS